MFWGGVNRGTRRETCDNEASTHKHHPTINMKETTHPTPSNKPTNTNLQQCRQHRPVDVFGVELHLVLKAAKVGGDGARCCAHGNNVTTFEGHSLQQAV